MEYKLLFVKQSNEKNRHYEKQNENYRERKTEEAKRSTTEALTPPAGNGYVIFIRYFK